MLIVFIILGNVLVVRPIISLLERIVSSVMSLIRICLRMRGISRMGTGDVLIVGPIISLIKISVRNVVGKKPKEEMGILIVLIVES